MRTHGVRTHKSIGSGLALLQPAIDALMRDLSPSVLLEFFDPQNVYIRR